MTQGHHRLTKALERARMIGEVRESDLVVVSRALRLDQKEPLGPKSVVRGGYAEAYMVAITDRYALATEVRRLRSELRRLRAEQEGSD